LFVIGIAVLCSLGGYWKGYFDHKAKVEKAELKEEVRVLADLSDKKDQVIKITEDHAKTQDVIREEAVNVEDELKKFEITLRSSYDKQLERMRNNCQVDIDNTRNAAAIQTERKLADLHADMSVALSRLGSEYARELDDARARGLGCERTYDTYTRERSER